MTTSMFRGLQRDHYDEVLADVPWRYMNWSDTGANTRSPDNHYETMTLADIKRMPVKRYVKPNSRLWFCVPGAFLAIGAHLPIMRAWGFEPASIAFTWIKCLPKHHAQFQMFSTVDELMFKMGMGRTTRRNAEFIVLGNRGKPPPRKSAAIRDIIIEPARQHSRKPEKLYAAIEQFSHGTKLELFGRQQRNGWTVVGHESRKFG